ncbi:MAG TPA: FeoA family protein [Phycisphaerae bacterium]|nr:ferrous iron transport protein A [Phycisphaerales bacterium]HNO79623.1 FeoA family protein [Phycisphaerae bacterium]
MIAQNPRTLADLKASAKATVLSLQGEPAVQQRLAEMGLTSGRQIRMVRVAPLGDPYQIEVLNYHLSLRRRECECVLLATDPA